MSADLWRAIQEWAGVAVDGIPGPATARGIIDKAGIVVATAPRITPPLIAGPSERVVGAKGVAIIREFEGCHKRRPDGRVEAYPDPATGGDPWTIGWGSTGPDHYNGGQIRRGTIWTQRQCDDRLAEDLVRYSRQVNAALAGAATTPDQFDALVSLAYNVGPARVANSTLLRRHIAGRYADAANEFGRWIYAGGRVMNGLVRRRAAEAALYRGQR